MVSVKGTNYKGDGNEIFIFEQHYELHQSNWMYKIHILCATICGFLHRHTGWGGSGGDSLVSHPACIWQW